MRYEPSPHAPTISWKIWPLLAIALSFAGCAVTDADAKKAQTGDQVAEAGKVRKVQPNDPSGDKKVGTGQSFKGLTQVEVTPVPAAAPGWFSETAASGEDDWEPAIAVDPGNANFVYQLVTRYTGPKPCGNCKLPAIRLRRSTDAGATWTESWLKQTTKAQYDPQIMVDINGNVHAAFLNGTTPGSTYVKSTDHGATWPTIRDWGGNGAKPQWNDHPWLGLSRNGNDIYIGFNSSDSYAVASHNGGVTWSNPVKMNTDARYYFHQGVAVSPTNGNVAYIATSDYTSGNTYNGDSFVKVWKTTNGGTSWTSVLIDTSKQVPPCGWAAGCTQGFFGTTPSMAIDSAGKLLIAYHINTVDNAPEQMYVRTSTDGVTWTARQQISVANSAVNNAFPAVAAHPTTAGDFRVTWQDDRLASTTGFNTWYKRTTNGGSTWSTDIRVSDLTSGAPYKNVNGYLFPYGDYQEISVGPDGVNQLTWGEGASYTGPGGCWNARGQ
jgi:hypothetical protein